MKKYGKPKAPTQNIRFNDNQTVTMVTEDKTKFHNAHDVTVDIDVKEDAQQ